MRPLRTAPIGTVDLAPPRRCDRGLRQFEVVGQKPDEDWRYAPPGMACSFAPWPLGGVGPSSAAVGMEPQ